MATTLLDAGTTETFAETLTPDRRPPAAAPVVPARAPVEAVAGAQRYRLPVVARSVAAAAAIALLLGSQGLLTWADNLPVGPLADRVLAVAQAWHDAMDALGLTRFGDAAEAGLVRLRGHR